MFSHKEKNGPKLQLKLTLDVATGNYEVDVANLTHPHAPADMDALCDAIDDALGTLRRTERVVPQPMEASPTFPGELH